MKNTRNFTWHSPFSKPFVISGFGWFDEERTLRRLPKQPNVSIPDPVNHLANHTSGGQIRFQSDTANLFVKVKLKGKADMVHMPATGQCGVDCYISKVDEHKNFQYVWTSIFPHDGLEYEAQLFTDHMTKEMRNIVLFLPLYQGVEHIEIGVDEDAQLLGPPSYESTEKIVIYGTSITQGGCAARPGMSYSNILSRKIPFEFINLGFSGNGRGEKELAQLCAEIANPALFIVDYEGNAGTPADFEKTLPVFIETYRKVHPTIPILIPSRVPYAREQITPHLYEMRMKRKAIIKSLIRRRKEQGDENIYFFDHSQTFGEDDFFECTVDGSHPTDLGFHRMANALEAVISSIVYKR